MTWTGCRNFIADGHAGHTQILALFDRKDQAGYTGLSAAQTTLHHFAFTIAVGEYEMEKKRLEALGLAVRGRSNWCVMTQACSRRAWCLAQPANKRLQADRCAPPALRSG